MSKMYVQKDIAEPIQHLVDGLAGVLKLYNETVLKPMLEADKAYSDDGIGRISKERDRQINEEGWTEEHDKHHDRQQLAAAAMCYIAHYIGVDPGSYLKFWPWNDDLFKPIAGSNIRNLEKAGALIAAEIDRVG